MKKSKYYFYLNPHVERAWTKCPKCNIKTKVRKFCLLIHYGDELKKYHQLISLNKTCKFCGNCDLLIAKRSDIDFLLQEALLPMQKNFKQDNYFVFGTMERKDWKRGQQNSINPSEALDKVNPFKDVWTFEIRPTGI